MRSAQPFVGRSQAARRLQSALTRSPLLVVWGAGGLGKSTLVRRTVGADALWVSFRGADRHEPPLLDAARVLVAEGEPSRIDWDALIHSPEALRDLVVELTSRRCAPLVLDDAHHLAPERECELLSALTLHATPARFIVTTRRSPGEVVPALEVGPLSRRDMAALVRALVGALPPASVRALVDAAEGSPWRLKQLVGGASRPERGKVDDAGQRALEQLAWLDCPLPPELACALVPGLAPRLESFEERGWIERETDRIRLHELAREPLIARTPPRDAERGAVATLVRRDELDLVLRGVQLALDAGNMEIVTDALARHGEALLVAGFAIRLWSALEGNPAPALARHRFRAALAVGDSQALGLLQEPEEAEREPELAWMWAEALMARGDVAEARDYADAASQRFRSADGERLRLTLAIATANTGNLRGALALLDQVEGVDREVAARRDASRATVLALLGHIDEALAVATAARSEVVALEWPARAAAGEKLARAFYLSGRLNEAARLLDVCAGSDESGSARLDLPRRVRTLRAAIEVERGALKRVREELSRVEPWIPLASMFRPYLALAWGHWALASGDVPRAVTSSGELSRSAEVASVRDEAALFGLRLAVVLRMPVADSFSVESGSLFGSLAAPLHAEALVRAGRLAPEEALSRFPPHVPHPEATLANRRTRAVALLVADRPAEALAELEAALRVARDAGFGVREADLLALEADALVLLGHWRALPRVTSALGDLGRAQPAPRLERIARLLGAVAAPCLDDPGALQGIWTEADTAPVASLRAGAILGEPSIADELDLRVVAAVASRPGWTPPLCLRGAGQATWGLDRARRRAWLEDGRYVDFAKQSTKWRVLDVLASRGGSATKEELVLGAWNEASYHPLRHDNRLHALVRKLRRSLGDKSGDLRLHTLEHGYALGGTVRVLGGSTGGTPA